MTDSRRRRALREKDILLSVPEDLKDRMVNTIAWTRPFTGIHQQQKFIRKGIAERMRAARAPVQHGQTLPAGRR